MMKKFVTIFEKTENIHLIKDVGQIPYLMHKQYGYDATIVTVKNSKDYSYLEDEVKGLKLKFIPKLKFGRYSIATIYYLLVNAKKIDVLHLFHHREPTYIYAMIYKKLNPLGHLYVKSDKGYRDIVNNDGFFNMSKKRHQKRDKLFNKALAYIDTISVENEGSYDFLIKKYPKNKEKFFYLTNALDLDAFYKKIPPLDFDKKENLILTVGRIGAKEKNNQMLLDALSKVDLKTWRVELIGPIEKEFQNNIELFYKKNPHLKDKVVFTGAINDRTKLLSHYARAKIFCLTSIEESFGFVMIEAMAYGNYVITTNVSSASDITKNEELGKIVHSTNELSQSIQAFINHEDEYKKKSSLIRSYVNEKYNWNDVVKLLQARF